MKVSLLADNANHGGVGRYCVNLAQGLIKRGIETTIIVPVLERETWNGWLFEQADAVGVTASPLNMRRTFDPRAVVRLGEHLVQDNIQILHTQSYRSSIIGRLAVLYANKRLSADVRAITTLHGGMQQFEHASRLRLYSYVDLLTSRLSTHLIAVDRQTKRDYVSRGVPADRISVIYNGVNLPNDILAEHRSISLHAKQRPTVIGFVGRLSFEKGIDYLAYLVESVLMEASTCTFLVIGDGPERSLLNELQNGRFGKRLRLLGYVDDVEPYYDLMDVVVIPSRSEGLPFVALEAMAHGLPVVATAVGGLLDLINSDVNGILVPPGDKSTLTQAVLQLTSNPERLHELAQNARKTIIDRFSVEVMCQQTYELYRSVDINTPRP